MAELKFFVRQHERRTTILGFIPIIWIANDSVDCGSSVCKFDFDKGKVYKVTGDECMEIAIISKFKNNLWHPRLLPFVGVIITPEFSVETYIGFMGNELKMDLRFQGERISRKVDSFSKSIRFDKFLSIEMDQRKKNMIVKTESRYENISMIIGAIIFKFTMEYMQSGGGA